MNIQHDFISTNQIYLHIVTAGPLAGPPVILLHGFPECWYGWHNQIPYLAERGFRVIAPDQRGYNLSAKPAGISAYHIDELAKDIVGLMDSLEYKRVYLAGHDWGAAVAWRLAAHFPERLRRLAILNVPHPAIMRQAAERGDWRQLARSWYIYFFQLPWLPERLLRLSGATSRNILTLSSRHDTFSPDDLAVYRRAWTRPGALTGMVNWYRAARALFWDAPMPAAGSIQTPTLMLWGERDVALGKELAQPSIDLCAEGRLIFYPRATHWVQHDAADEVNEQLALFFAA